MKAKMKFSVFVVVAACFFKDWPALMGDALLEPGERAGTHSAFPT